MPYYFRNTSIDDLDFSARINHALHRAKIETIGDMIEFPAESWASVRNLGATSIAEIQAFLSGLQADGIRFHLDTNIEAAVPQQDRRSEFGDYCDVPIESLSLSNRARNSLKRAGINTVKQLQEKNEEELCSIPNLGVTGVREIVERLSRFTTNLEQMLGPATVVASGDNILSIAKDASAAYGIDANDAVFAITDVRRDNPNVRGESFVWLFYQVPLIRNALKSYIITLLEQSEKGICPESIPIPEHLRNTNIVEACLVEMDQAKEVFYSFDHVSRRYPTALEYVQSISDERACDMLYERLNKSGGDGTLEAIGRKWGIERERVRQVCEKYLRRRPRLQEDSYRYIFDNYIFSCRDFCLAFDEPVWVYNYLEMTRAKHLVSQASLEEALSDVSLSPETLHKIERIVYKGYVLVDGVQIPKRRPDLVRFFVQRECREPMEYSRFVSKFNAFVSGLELAEIEDLLLDTRTYENKFQKCDYVLWSPGRNFRYYDIAGIDAEQVLAELNLEQYNNLEISTLRIFRDYLELMQRLDIRSEYELHNFLKKIYPEDRELKIEFSRMPTLRIGSVDVDGQVLDLLLQYAPIEATELAKKYEEQYGIKSSTVQGNLFSRIDTYYHNGMFTIEAYTLPPFEHSRMKELLFQEFYSRDEVEQIYCREFPDSDIKNINPYTMKTLGFQVYSNYYLKEACGNAIDYFRQILTADDIFRSEDHSAAMQRLTTFSSVLNQLKHERVLTEFSPKQYINIRRLEAVGITKETLDQYSLDVLDFVGPKAFFTPTSLKQDGFRHALDAFDFDDSFYASVVEADHDHFQCQRTGRAKLLYSGSEHIGFASFIRWLVEREGRIDQYELMDRLEKYYGLHTELYKVLEAAREENLYYNPIMEAIYIDYDTYFEEV